MGNKIEMRGSVVPCSGACGHVFEGSRKENYPHVSKMCVGLYSFASDMSGFFDESDNSFCILKIYFFSFLCYSRNNG